jgi:DNA-binding NarL/FixJ family response regulator
MIRVILVDDHALFRLGLKGAITSNDITVVGEAGSGQALFRMLETVEADIVLLDVGLPDMSGIEVARYLRREHPTLKILTVSAENTSPVVEALLNIGIDGFISKSVGESEDIAYAIRAIMSGLEYFGKDITSVIYDIVVAKKKSNEPSPEFTEREREVIELCRRGLLAKEIAAQLGISLRTVHNHKYHIFQKLGINNTMEMVQYALRHGIIRME